MERRLRRCRDQRATWQIAHPIASKSADPFLASAVNASRPSRGGAFVARTNRAKRSMSERPSAPGLSSDLSRYRKSSLPPWEQAIRDSHLVQVASAAKESKLAC